MTQAIIGTSDALNIGFVPGSNYYQMFASFGTMVGTSSENGGLITAQVVANLGAPDPPDPGTVSVVSQISYISGSSSFPDLNSINAELNIYRVGVKITELSGGAHLAPAGGGGPTTATISKSSDVTTLCTNYGQTPATMFLGLTAEFLVNGNVVGTPGDNVMQVGGGGGETSFQFHVPDSSSPAADIEVTGEGGVLVSGEADVESSGMPLIITGSGGVLVGSGGGSTPAVLSKDPSGMYTLIPDRHFDRVYTRNSAADDTTDVAIPTPFAKTGYFGG